jgi:hypothetical protein
MALVAARVSRVITPDKRAFLNVEVGLGPVSGKATFRSWPRRSVEFLSISSTWVVTFLYATLFGGCKWLPFLKGATPKPPEQYFDLQNQVLAFARAQRRL